MMTLQANDSQRKEDAVVIFILNEIDFMTKNKEKHVDILQ